MLKKLYNSKSSKQRNMIPVFKPLIQSSEINAASKSLKEGWLGMGKYVKDFEKQIEKLCKIEKSKSVVAVSTGHAALHLSLKLLKIKKGDEVITPSFNNTADFQAIKACGANPVFVDIEEKTFCIDVNKIENSITKKTKCIIAMDYGSSLCNHKYLKEISRKYDIPIIHDAAHSFASQYEKSFIGNQHQFTIFSFDPVKSITCIDGGAIILNKKEYENKAQAMRLIGMNQSAQLMYTNNRAWTYDVLDIGYRYHLSNIHAAIGLEQLKKIELIKKTRQDSFLQYNLGLKNISWLSTPEENIKNKCPFIYTIRVLNGRRNELRTYLSNLAIDTGIHWQPGHKFKYFQNERKHNLQITEKISEQILTLPFHTYMEAEDIDYIIKCIKEFR
tara:strand:- start:1301 stop:2464 length:1164 start_codon:yes stop_codon:yes gene_type:complete